MPRLRTMVKNLGELFMVTIGLKLSATKLDVKTQQCSDIQEVFFFKF